MSGFGSDSYLRRFQASDPSRVCVCGHDYANHHQQFGTCTVVVPNPDYTPERAARLARKDPTAPSLTNALACACTGYRRAIPPERGSASWLQDIYDATGAPGNQNNANTTKPDESVDE